jgi:hypothetical protein
VDDHALTNVLLDEQSIVRRRSWGDREFGGPLDAGGSREWPSQTPASSSTLDRALHFVPAGRDVIVLVVVVAFR